MKNKLFIICLIIWFIVCVIIAAGLFLDGYFNRKYNRINPRTSVMKVISNESWAFKAYEIRFGINDKMIVIHHLWSPDSKTKNWGDATIYYNGKAY